jgi:transcription elongation factor Elf1
MLWVDMEDQSDLDKKYFIDETVYNCPYCNRNNVIYVVLDDFEFDWSNDKKCYVYLVECSSCKKVSIHLSFDKILNKNKYYDGYFRFQQYVDIDSNVFYSQPTSFFVIDSRIARILRELITEAEGCLKMNYPTGASACMRKAIYELLVLEKAEGDDYESRIKHLKKKHPESNPSYFDTLAHIQDMTSDKIHEQSWDKWDSHYLKLIIETLKSVLYDIYVIPEIKKQRSLDIQQLREAIKQDKGKDQSA